MRLDLYFTDTRKDFSRSIYQKFIRDIGVKVNGKLTHKPHFPISENDKIDFSEKDLRKMVEVSSAVEDFPKDKLDIIADEKGFLVINKPPFVRTESITKGLLPVHRLDKDTSGVLVAAKDMNTQGKLQEQWQKRLVVKTYMALVKGLLKPKKGAIEGAIFRSTQDRRKMAISSFGKAREAFTEYEVVDSFKSPALDEKFCFIKVFPKTGRTHQIRVHFSSIEHPIVGDDLYGDKKLNKIFEQVYGLRRQFLHANSLKITNPDTGKKQVFISELPDDLKSVMAKLS